jgi:hypothetical protein
MDKLRTLGLFVLFGVLGCVGQTTTPLYRLLYSPMTGDPLGGLVYPTEVRPGLIYALSPRTGTTYGATIFSVTSTGTFKSVYVFPYANNTHVLTLVQAGNGMLYGSEGSSNGYNYVSISPSGTNLALFPFPGQMPNQWGSLSKTIVAPPGNIYDTAAVGNPYTYGLARIADNGTISIVHQFLPNEAAPNPFANIIYGPDGNVYGIGNPPNHNFVGFIYRVTPGGTYSALLQLPSFVASSHGTPLVAAADGNLYGTFPAGGTSNQGFVYQATLSGQYAVVANFPATGMIEPGGLLLAAADGNIYGTTNSNDIFRYDLSAKKLELVYHLSLGQGRCYCQLIEGMDGKLYGAAPTGGYVGAGTIFSLDIGLPKPQPLVSGMYPSSGPVGKKVVLWGNYLLGATSVTFNGTPAVNPVATSVQSVVVPVPSGATTGPVSVTTANGTFTTTQNFTVQ